MTKKDEIINYIFSGKSKPIHRKEYFKTDFVSFCFYYFPGEFSHIIANFQKDYMRALHKGDDVFFVGFRECGKSMFLTMHYVYTIIYGKKKFIMHYNSEIEQAKGMLRDVISILQTNEKIIQDYGFVYIPAEGTKRGEGKQKTVSEFISENGVKMKAMSIGKSPRGQKFVFDGVTYRPDLIGFDDLDNEKNTNNPSLIEKDCLFILGEVFGGVSSFAQKIFLGNVVKEDGRVPRLKKHFESDKRLKIKIFWIPIRNKGIISWNRFVATDKIAEDLNKNIENIRDKFISLESRRREQGTIGFNQNYNLIAYKSGSQIIKESDIKNYISLPKNYKVVIGIDPAFSEKTGSDAIGLTVTAQEIFQGDIFKYVIEILEFVEDEKDEERFCNTVSNLYHKYKCNLINIEGNNGGLILARMLKKRGLAVNVINAEKDKVTRVREYQGEFERGIIKFNPDNFLVGKLVEQLKTFPGGDKDDMVDSAVHSFASISTGVVRLI